MIHILYRCHDRTASVNGLPRPPFVKDKAELIRVAFQSLFDSSRGFPVDFHVLGDDLTPDLLDFFRRFPVTLDNRTPMGNDRSILETVHLAAGFPDEDWVYFCEDDYLHQPEFFQQINELIEGRDHFLAFHPKSFFTRLLAFSLFRPRLSQRPLYLFPQDYPDWYQPERLTTSLLFRAPGRVWRQCPSSTFTFLTQSRWVKRYRKVFLRSSRGANDGYLSKVLYADVVFAGRGLCLSPIPSLAAHCHVGTLPRDGDWAGLYERVLKSLRED